MEQLGLDPSDPLPPQSETLDAEAMSDLLLKKLSLFFLWQDAPDVTEADMPATYFDYYFAFRSYVLLIVQGRCLLRAFLLRLNR